MTLLAKIAGALGRDRGTIARDFRGYVVDDLCPTQPAPKTILLLESPHTNEVCKQHPLAGSAGKRVTKLLRRNQSIKTELDRLAETDPNFNGSEAIGSILKCHPRTLRLGVMNASLLPLQIGAHSDDNRRQYGEFLCFLNMVKLRPRLLLAPARRQATHRAAKIYCVLLEDLKSRLERLPASVCVVPCGEVARAFVAKARSLPGYQDRVQICGGKVPHPSSRHWDSGTHVDSLLNIIKTQAGLAP